MEIDVLYRGINGKMFNKANRELRPKGTVPRSPPSSVVTHTPEQSNKTTKILKATSRCIPTEDGWERE